MDARKEQLIDHVTTSKALVNAAAAALDQIRENIERTEKRNGDIKEAK